MKQWITCVFVSLVVWLARRLGYVLVEEGKHQAAIAELTDLVEYTEHSGYLNEDHKAKKHVLRRVGWALLYLDPPAFARAGRIVMGLEEEWSKSA